VSLKPGAAQSPILLYKYILNISFAIESLGSITDALPRRVNWVGMEDGVVGGEVPQDTTASSCGVTWLTNLQ
jgi:hypothetical protein